MIKVCIIINNVNDFKKPVDMISSKLQFVIFSSGLIWSRWCFLVTPQLHFLAAVNFIMCNTAIYQLYRK